jgi:Protein of unknown function DUF2625
MIYIHIITLNICLSLDHGWIRILGSGSAKMDRSFMDWNQGKTFTNLGEVAPFLLIGDDVLGGFFAINGGGLAADDLGQVFYFAPDDLNWLPTGLGYSDFIDFCLTGDIKSFYEGLYWTSWEKDVETVTGDQGFAFYPYLCTDQGKDMEKNARSVVPIEELWLFQNELRKSLLGGK